MRFGKTENNGLCLSCKYLLILFIFCLCAFSVACQSKEQKIDAALRQCQQLLDTDDVDQAYKCYLKVGKTYPENDPYIVDTGDKAIFRKCVEFKSRKDFEQAALCFEGLTHLRPEGANIYFLLADSYFENYKKAKENSAYFNVELLDKAEIEIKKSLKIESEIPVVIETYGEILSEKGDLQGALREHQKSVKLSPKEGWMWIKLAFVQEKLEQNEDAIKSYEQALIIDSKNMSALWFLGLLYEKLGKLDEAIKSIEQYGELKPTAEEVTKKLKGLKEKREELLRQKKSKSKAVGSVSATGGDGTP